jgi:hypothetical protein
MQVPNMPVICTFELSDIQANDIRYYKLDGAQSIASQLANKRIIEYPTIFVCLPEDVENFKEYSGSEQLPHKRKHDANTTDTALLSNEEDPVQINVTSTLREATQLDFLLNTQTIAHQPTNCEIINGSKT